MVYRSWQYKLWEPWGYSEQKNQRYWKSDSLCKKNRPLCGAKCRDGHPCKAKAVTSKAGEPINGRCRIHGGLSTGTKTVEGKEKSREAARSGMLAYWAKKREFIP